MGLATLELETNYYQGLRKYLIMLPFFYFLFLGCSPIKQTILTFKYDDFILVQVTINDTLSGNMIFDTGSNHTIVYKKFIKFNENIKIKESKITDLYGNIDNIEYSKVKKFSIGNQNLSNVKIRFNNLNNVYTKNNIIGILGTDIISKYSWAFDFRNKKLKINSTIDYNNLNVLNIDFKKKSVIKENITIANKRISNLRLDTGCLCQLTLNSRDKPNLQFETEMNLITSIIGKENEYDIDFSNLGELGFKSYKIDSIQVQSSEKFKNLLGLDLFKQDILVIDGINDKFYYSDILKYRPNQNTKLGLRFGFRNEKMFVTAIIKDSVSHKKGIKLGDVIESINDNTIKISENTLDSINNNRNNIKNITIKRKDEILKFHFEK